MAFIRFTLRSGLPLISLANKAFYKNILLWILETIAFRGV